MIIKLLIHLGEVYPQIKNTDSKFENSNSNNMLLTFIAEDAGGKVSTDKRVVNGLVKNYQRPFIVINGKSLLFL